MGTPALPATGRPGRAVEASSLACTKSTAPAHSPTPPAGYEPQALDATIQAYVSACEVNTRVAKALSLEVEKAVTSLLASPHSRTPEEQADLVTKLHDRLAKANLNLVKSTDELTRLRSFLAGGPDQRTDLSVKGEIELTAMVLTAVRAMGWRVVDAGGVEVEVLGA